MELDEECGELDRLLRNAAEAAAHAESCHDQGRGGDPEERDREAATAHAALVERVRRLRSDSPDVIQAWVSRQVRALEAFLEREKAAGRPPDEPAVQLLEDWPAVASGQRDVVASLTNLHDFRLWPSLMGEAALDEAPPVPDATLLRSRGLLFHRRGDQDKALADFTRAIELDPDHAETYGNRGTVLLALGRAPEAVADFSRLIAARPAAAGGYYDRGLAHLELRDHGRACEDLARATELDLRLRTAHMKMGEALHSLGRLEDAAASFGRAIELDGDDPGAFHARAMVRKQLGRIEEATADFTRVTELNPGRADAWRGLISIWGLGASEKNVEAHTRLLELEPGDAGHWGNRGILHNQLRRPEQALADFTRAIELDPSLAWAYRNRAQALVNLDRPEEARADVDRAIELAPAWAFLRFFRGLLRRERGDRPGALEDLSRAGELDPSHVATWENRGVLLASLGRHDEALADHARARALAPSTASVVYNTACVYGLMGRPAEAAEWLGRAIAMDARYKESARSDPDFARVLDSPEFQAAPVTDADVSRFFDSVEAGRVPAVERLLEAGVSVNAERDGRAPLMVAADQARPRVAELLIQAGADVDACDESGRTATYKAAIRLRQGRPGKAAREMLKMLLEAPGDALSRHRRRIEAADLRKKPRPEVLAAGDAFVDAVARGEDISRHVPPLLACWCDAGDALELRERLAKVLVLQLLRQGKHDEIERLSQGWRPYQKALADPLDAGFAFALNHGADLRPVYALMIERLGQECVWRLYFELERHPERLPEVSQAVLARAPEVLPRLVAKLVAKKWRGDASALVAPLLALLPSADRSVRSASATAIEALVRDADVDPSAALSEAEAALGAGRDTRLAALLIVQHGLRAGPPRWELVDRLCRHEQPEARLGAMQALYWAWPRLDAADPITVRLAAALADDAEPPRRHAAAALEDGIRRGFRLGDVDASVIAILLQALPRHAETVAPFLRAYAASDRRRAEGMLAQIAAGHERADAVAELTRLCADVVEGRYQRPCPTCGGLGDEEKWGESIGGPDTPPPPEFERLQACGRVAGSNTELYRCPACGTYFERQTFSETFLAGNSDYDSYRLSRWVGPGEELEVRDRARESDVRGLSLLLRSDRDDAARERMLKTLWTLMTEHSLDVGPWEADLGALAGSPSAAIRREAVANLGLHLARSGRHDEVRGLCESGDGATVCGALKALRMAGTGAARHLDRVRALLDAEDERVRHAAWNIVRDMHGAATVAAVTRCLDSQQAEVRKDATWYFRQATEKGANIRPALPRLQVLARKGDRWAREAIATAARLPAEQADAVAVLVEWLRSRPSDMEAARDVYYLGERGADISPACAALAACSGDAQSWALSALKEAVEGGADISAAVEGLQRIAAVPGYPSETAAQILGRHFAQRKD